MYGLVIAHDPDMLLTYLIPIKAIIDRVLAVLPGLADPSGNLFLTSFKAMPETPDLIQGVQKNHPSKERDGSIVHKQLSDSDADDDISIITEYSHVLAVNSLKNHEGLRYVRVPALIEWLSQTKSTGEMNLQLLLDHSYSQLIMVPISAKSLLKGPRAGVVLFCILLELGMGNVIDQFVRFELTDSALPIGAARVARVLPLRESQELFLKAQWAFCPVVLSLDMAVDLSEEQILPIYDQRLISSGGTAQVFEIVILEDFVTESLRQVCRRSRHEIKKDGKKYAMVRLRFRFFVVSVDLFSRFTALLSRLSMRMHWKYMKASSTPCWPSETTVS